MKKAIITMVSVLFLLATMATANATVYTSSGTASADFVFSGFDNNDPLKLSLSNIVVSGTPNLPPYPGLYDWSLDVTRFAVTLGGGGSFAVGPLATIDIGTYALPPLTTPGSANLGNVIIPFALFGQGTGSLALDNLTVGWSEFINNSIVFTISAADADMAILKGYLRYLDNLAHTDLGALNGIGSGHIDVSGSLTAAPVPEPSSVILLGIGLIGLAGACRKRFRK